MFPVAKIVKNVFDYGNKLIFGSNYSPSFVKLKHASSSEVIRYLKKDERGKYSSKDGKM